jgi:pyrroline-5-carboxylate reductase
MNSDDMHKDEQPLRVLMIGCGKMGGALLSRWVRAERFAFTVADPAGPPPFEVDHVAGPDDLGGKRFDMAVAAVKPQMLAKVLPPYTEHLGSDAFILSMAAGSSAASIAGMAGGLPVIRIMPNLPAAVGRGVSALFAGEGAAEHQKAAAEELASAAGSAVWLETEDGIDRFTAVAGSGPGYVFELLRAYQEAAEELGFDQGTARSLVLETMAGAAAMALEDERSFEELRRDVTSPNGTTQAGLEALTERGLVEERLRAAVRGAYERAVELR